jgi:hypothetical protein
MAETRSFDYHIATHCLVARPAEMASNTSIFTAATGPLLRLHSIISGAVEYDLTLLLIARMVHYDVHAFPSPCTCSSTRLAPSASAVMHKNRLVLRCSSSTSACSDRTQCIYWQSVLGFHVCFHPTQPAISTDKHEPTITSRETEYINNAPYLCIFHFGPRRMLPQA